MRERVRVTCSSDKFSFSIDHCDVEDRDRLTSYRHKRLQWFEWLDEARRLNALKNQSSSTSSLVTGLLDQGFAATQILAIRRLTDASHDVISLRRLLNDIEKHEHLITREIFVGFDGVPFDPKQAEGLIGLSTACRHPEK